MLEQALLRPDKSVFITGAATGVGKASVERFSQEPNYTIYAAGLSQDTIEQTFSPDQFPQVVPIEMDVRDYGRSTDVIDYIANEEGGIDVLVNNAGIMRMGSPLQFWFTKDGRSHIADLVHTNSLGPTALMEAAIPHMRERGDGTIINILSTQYFQPHWPGLEYARSKKIFMQATIVSAFLEKVVGTGVNIVAIQPGRINHTSIDNNSWIQGTPQVSRDAAQEILGPVRKRIGMQPETLAEIIYEVAERKRKGSYIIVGNDAKLSTALALIPGWPLLFQLGFAGLTEAMKYKILLKQAYEEMTGRENK